MQPRETFRLKYLSKDVKGHEKRGFKGATRSGKIETQRNNRRADSPISLEFLSSRTDLREDIKLMLDDKNAVTLVRHLLIDTDIDYAGVYHLIDLLMTLCPVNDAQRLALVRKICGEAKQVAKKTG